MFDSVKRKLVCYDDNEYYIEISPLTNTIRATLCCKGAIKAYLDILTICKKAKILSLIGDWILMMVE